MAGQASPPVTLNGTKAEQDRLQFERWAKAPSSNGKGPITALMAIFSFVIARK